jgi:hypothetical protein
MWQESASNLDDRVLLGVQRFPEDLECCVRVDGIAARKQIDRSEPVFRPRVNREVGFCDDDDSSHSVRRERMHEVVNRSGTGLGYCREQMRANAFGVIEGLSITPVIFAEQMPAQ